MPNARFKLSLHSVDQYLSHGKEQLELAFSANKGSDFGSLKKVASGGELSRIMLAVKAILSQYKTLPSIIFDEIDTGVSGEVAHKIAEIIASYGVVYAGNYHYTPSSSRCKEPIILRFLKKLKTAVPLPSLKNSSKSHFRSSANASRG